MGVTSSVFRAAKDCLGPLDVSWDVSLSAGCTESLGITSAVFRAAGKCSGWLDVSWDVSSSAVWAEAFDVTSAVFVPGDKCSAWVAVSCEVSLSAGCTVPSGVTTAVVVPGEEGSGWVDVLSKVVFASPAAATGSLKSTFLIAANNFDFISSSSGLFKVCTFPTTLALTVLRNRFICDLLNTWGGFMAKASLKCSIKEVATLSSLKVADSFKTDINKAFVTSFNLSVRSRTLSISFSTSLIALASTSFNFLAGTFTPLFSFSATNSRSFSRRSSPLSKNWMLSSSSDMKSGREMASTNWRDVAS